MCKFCLGRDFLARGEKPMTKPIKKSPADKPEGQAVCGSWYGRSVTASETLTL
ncbi:MAG: hypothetical protein ABSG53_33300 [Thermoguttaceae bacterium]|jgi:hypothetical protein